MMLLMVQLAKKSSIWRVVQQVEVMPAVEGLLQLFEAVWLVAGVLALVV